MVNNVKRRLNNAKLKYLDASRVTGQNVLDKIWSLISGVPAGVALITEKTPSATLNNIFCELGMMDALGKQTLVIKSGNVDMPSDLSGVEYLDYDSGSKDFVKGLNSWTKDVKDAERFFVEMVKSYNKDSGNTKNPLNSIDYYRRAFLVSGKQAHITAIGKFQGSRVLDPDPSNSIENLLISSMNKSKITRPKQAAAKPKRGSMLKKRG